MFALIELFSVTALTLLVVRQEEHLACKKLWWGVVISLERSADDLHMVLLPLHLVLH